MAAVRIPLFMCCASASGTISLSSLEVKDCRNPAGQEKEETGDSKGRNRRVT
jgi:hypothetical protein